MSPFRRNWEQYRFNQNETENWDLDENNDEQYEEAEEDLTLLLEDAQDAVSRFMSKESRRGERNSVPAKKSRPAWQ